MDQTPEQGPNRRQFFRLRLPVTDRLIVRIEGLTLHVAELAERSLEIVEPHVPNRNGRCEGVIVWSDGRQSRIEGRLGHLNREGHRIIVDVSGVKTSDVMREQRLVLQKFPLNRDGGGSEAP